MLPVPQLVCILVTSRVRRRTHLAKLRDSKYAEHWTRATESELEDHAANVSFSDENIPQGVSVISAKWDFCWKTDSNGFMTKVRARLVARGFEQQSGVDYLETFVPTPAISSDKVILAVAVQQGWKLQHWDAEQAFVNPELNVEVCVKLPAGYGERSGKVVRLERVFC